MTKLNEICWEGNIKLYKQILNSSSKINLKLSVNTTVNCYVKV